MEDFVYLDRMTDIPHHDEQGTRDRPFDLIAHLDPDRLRQALAAAGLRLWLDRPTLAVSVAIRARDGASFRMTPEDDESERHRQALLAAADRFGMRVAFATKRATSLDGELVWSEPISAGTRPGGCCGTARSKRVGTSAASRSTRLSRRRRGRGRTSRALMPPTLVHAGPAALVLANKAGTAASFAGTIDPAREARLVKDWNDLRFFLSVARLGSLSAAARALKVDPADRRTTHRQPRGRARPALFRAPGGRLPTDPSGRKLQQHAERVDRTSSASRARSTPRSSEVAGLVTVTTSDSSSLPVLIPALPMLRDKHPGIRIDLISSNQVLSLARREADVAVRTVRPEEGDLLTRKIGTLRYGLFASPIISTGTARRPPRRFGTTCDDRLGGRIPARGDLHWFRELASATKSHAAERGEGAAGGGTGGVGGRLACRSRWRTAPGSFR